MGINMESSRQLSVYNAFFAWLKAKFEKENPPLSPFTNGVCWGTTLSEARYEV
jgi:hypothetical protein